MAEIKKINGMEIQFLSKTRWGFIQKENEDNVKVFYFDCKFDESFTKEKILDWIDKKEYSGVGTWRIE